MIIKIILITAVVAVTVWSLKNFNSHQARAWQKLGVMFLTVLGVIVVWSPDTSNKVAHKLGIGRGADLLLYFLTLAFIFSTLSFYIKSKDNQRQIVVLARKLAILETKQPRKIGAKIDRPT